MCRGAEVIQYQIKGREQQRLLDAEKKDQETQAMLKYLERLQEEDMENLQKKRQSQKQLMEEVAQCNEVGQEGEGERERGWGGGGREGETTIVLIFSAVSEQPIFSMKKQGM